MFRSLVLLAILATLACAYSTWRDEHGNPANHVLEYNSGDRVQTGTVKTRSGYDPNQNWRLTDARHEPNIQFDFALKPPLVQVITREEATRYADPGWTIYDSGNREIDVAIDIPLGMRRQIPGVYEIGYTAFLKGKSPLEPLASAKRTCTVKDKNQCLDGTHDCSRQAECIHLNTGGYRCECLPGWRGNGKICNDIDECEEGTANCGLHAYCVNTPGHYDCHCNPGFFKNPNTGVCEDIDECATGQHDCHEFATCRNIPGSYDCKCKEGYTGNGRECSPINKCTSGMMNCHHYANCLIGKDKEFYCACKSGFRGDGVNYCDDIDECAEGIASCPEHSYCQNTVGSYLCHCERGFEMKGGVCVDIDECKRGTHTCPAHSTCYNEIGTYTCNCNDGFEMDVERRICVDFSGIPKLLLSGNNPLNMNQFETYSEPGFELEDEKEEIFLVVQNPKELNGIAKECGEFVITYSATDTVTKKSTSRTRIVRVNEVNVCTLQNSPFAHQCHPYARCNFLYGHCEYECQCPDGYFGDGKGPHGCRDAVAPIFKYSGEDRYTRDVCQVCGTSLDKPDLRDPIITEAYDNTFEGRVDVSDKISLRVTPSNERDCMEHYYSVSDVDGNEATKHITVCLNVEDMYTLIKNMESLYFWLVFVIKSTAVICFGAFLLFLLWEYGYIFSAIARTLLTNTASHDDKDIAYTCWYRLWHPTSSRSEIRQLVNTRLYPNEDDDDDDSDDDLSDQESDEDY